MDSLVGRLHAACESGNGVTFVISRNEHNHLLYSDLRRHALALLTELQRQGVEPGDEIVLQIRNDRDFLITFWACLLGRFIAVPLAVGTNDEHRRKVAAVWQRLDHPFLVVDTGSTAEAITRFAAEDDSSAPLHGVDERTLTLDLCEWFGGPNSGQHEAEAFPPEPSPDDIALIQFSSGSTGEPKGVIVTHRNAMVNTTDMIARLEITDDDRYLSWMPLTHDFGIIGMHLTPLVAGVDQVQMPTALFVRNPLVWLHAAHDHRATVIASPNFGYRHFLKSFTPAAAAGWDLSSVRLLQNGAEPISPSLCHEFLDALAPYGLDRQAMLPGYGLAEATLAVSYSLFEEIVPTVRLDRRALGHGDRVIAVDSEDPSGVEFVDVGFPVPSMEVRITDSAGKVLDDEMVGMIEIRGGSVTSGYYNDPAATARTIKPEGWLSTGDLGFMRGGRIVITGRSKDIIFVGGINYYPHDIERVALELEGIDVNKIAITGFHDESTERERVAAFVYFKRSLEEFLPLAEALRSHILRTIGLLLDDVVPVTSIPKTTSGKVQRFALAQQLQAGAFARELDELERLRREKERAESERALALLNGAVQVDHAPVDSSLRTSQLGSIRRQVRTLAEEVVGIAITDESRSLAEVGFDSVRAVELRNRLGSLYNLALPVSLIFDYPDIVSLAETIHERLCGDGAEAVSPSRDVTNGARSGAIAIIGVGCRLPGGIDSIDDLIRFLSNGEEATGDAPAWRWGETDTKGRRGSFRDDVDRFDPTPFGITPNEAEWLDPQQRFLLETSWDAIEEAMVHPDHLREEATGVFIGISSSEYARRSEGDSESVSHHALTGAMNSTAAGRISYTLGLNGPTLALDTACSSSLVALHLAVRSLRSGECRYALAGGVSLILDDAGFAGLEAIGALSSDGRCKAFGAAADGYGRGEGCGMVLLRPLEDALRDGQQIKGVILGSAMNHDGKSNGLTAPNGRAQLRVIRSAIEDAGCHPDDVGYIEAHGTGTALGDPQEVTALHTLFGTATRKGPMVIGSVKSNIGHLESAAGIAGVMKVLASLKARTIFRSRHAVPQNPHISWDEIAIEVAAEERDWQANAATPRIAGVSSFGLSGTNAHLIIGEHLPEVASDAPVISEGSDEVAGGIPDGLPLILPYAAAHRDALEARRVQYHQFVSEHEGDLRDLAAAAAVGRAEFPYRAAAVGRDREELLRSLDRATSPVTATQSVDGSVAWLFTGQGSQYEGMGKVLYHSVPHVRATVDHLSALFEPWLGCSLAAMLYSEEPARVDGSEFDINQTVHAQPAIFTLGYALASWFLSLGMKPDVVGGHSIGEYAAAVIAGVISLEDGVKLVAHRGRFMQELHEAGGMIALNCSETRARSMINGSAVSIAAVNGPESVVVSGSSENLQRLVERLCSEGIDMRTLKVSHAFHSALMEPAVERFRTIASAAEYHPSRIPFASSMTGTVLPVGEVLDASFWTRQIIDTVRFADLVADLRSHAAGAVLEIGATPVLCGLGAAQSDDNALQWIPTLRRNDETASGPVEAIAQLFRLGYTIDWRRIYPGPYNHGIALPPYPYQRRSFWREAPKRKASVYDSTSNGFDARPVNDAAHAAPLHASAASGNTATVSRDERMRSIVDQLRKVVADMTGYTPEDVPSDRDLFQLGLDSLVMMQLRRNIAEQYGVQLAASLFYRNATITSLAALVVEELGDHVEPSSQSVVDSTPTPLSHEGLNGHAGVARSETSLTNHGESDADSGLEEIVRMQLRLMSEQLDLLRGNRSQSVPAVASSEPTNGKSARSLDRVNGLSPSKNGLDRGSPRTNGTVVPGRNGDASPVPFVPFRPIATSGSVDTGEEAKERYVEELIERYCALTAKSKEATARFRSHFANNRNVAGFRLHWKELIYQLQVDRADGSRVYDIDGNEFIDLTMGFGVNLFGHNPAFIRTALADRLDGGIAVGPMSPLAGPVAERLARLTGVERAAFYNSGTEAIMVAIRLARGATGRDKVVIFSGSYHGTFDGVLALPGSGDPATGSLPLAPGVPESIVADLIVLPYGTDESLEFIRRHGETIAAVLVEPVQSRRPDFQPRRFLHELREITAASETALIFDEVITGFRVHPGGAQHHFDIRADIAVYGKVIGGGMPIGVVAGARRFLDLVDGGEWRFGDSSVPPSRNTFVAGTFCHHPLAMASAMATLDTMAERGEELCRALNEKTARLAGSLNEYFESVGVSLRIVHFGSLFRFVLTGEWELLYAALLTHGVYVWEGRNCFLSTAHSDDDIDRIRRAVIESVEEMIDAGFAPGAIPRSERIAPAPAMIPMSSVQRRLFALCMEPEGELAYHINAVIRFERGLDHDLAESVLRSIIARHEGLRTGFIAESGELWQRVEKRVEFDLEHVTLKDGEKGLDAAFIAAVRPFDLAAPPLMRAVHAEDRGAASFLIVDIHHIAADGISLAIIVQEFLEEYAARTSGGAARSVSALDVVQYRAFATWEEEFRRSEEFVRQESFWKELLAIESNRLTLPADGVPAERHPFRGGHLLRTIDRRPVDRLARENGASLYMVMLGLFSEFLRRISGERSFRFGTVHTGRSRPEFASTVGMFANSLVFPAAPDPGESFVDLLSEIKRLSSKIADNLDMPFEHLALLDPEVVRDQRVSLAFEVLDIDGALGEDVSIVTPTVDTGTSISDLTLNVSVIGTEIQLRLDYASDLFSPASAERLIGFLLRLLDGVVADPLRPLGAHAIVDDAERDVILGNAVVGPPVETLEDFIALFESHVERMPDAPAIYYDRVTPLLAGGEEHTGVISYRELDHRANGLARLLREEHGIGLGSEAGRQIVAILLDRSPEFLVAILGVLKAGGGFLAIEPSLPDERIRFMLRDTAASAIITSQQLIGRGASYEEPGLRSQMVIESVEPVDQFDSGFDRPGASFDPRNNPGAVAYMVYTSGSTGQPKGLMISRRNLANYAFWTTRDRVEHVGLSVFSLHISPAFDMMMAQIFPPLSSGRAIYVHHAELPVDRVMERCFSEETPINEVALTPSHALLLEGSNVERTAVRLVSIGGEALGLRHRDLFRRLNPNTQLYNDYGPAETTVSCIAHLVNSDGRVDVIGRPMPNSIAYILDDSLQPCPVGIVGEICVGGAVVGMGYINRPELTAERFLDDPFRPGERIYRTGDLGRLLDDGTIEFFGRKDRQIKLLGHRIEIGEIESALVSLPDILSAAVRLMSDEEGDYLAAWIVAAEGCSESEVREALATRLPYYMVPAIVTTVDALPLSRSGKVDHARLPAINRSKEKETEEIVADFTPTERVIADVWEEMLGQRITSPEANFYHAGGDSIKAIRITSRLRSKGYVIDAGAILKLASLRSIAAALSVVGDAAQEQASDAISSEGPLPLMPIQHWFFGLDLSERGHWNQELTLAFDHLLPLDLVRKALALVVVRHDVLRTSFAVAQTGSEPSAPRVDATIRPAHHDALERDLVVDEFLVTSARGSFDEQIAQAITSAHRRIDIERGPNLSALMIHAGGAALGGSKTPAECRTLLVLCAHHLVVDAVSWSIIVDDFLHACTALRDGREPVFPAKSGSIRAFATALVRESESPAMQTEISYWDEVVQRGADAGMLPFDGRTDNRCQEGMVKVARSLDRERTVRLMKEGTRPFSTKVDELLTGLLALALKEWTGNDCTMVSMERHGRSERMGVQLHATVGWFTTTFPLPLDGSGEVADVVVRTKESLRAVPGDGLGYLLLATMSSEGRSKLCGDRPAPVLFNYLGDLGFEEQMAQEGGVAPIAVMVEPLGDPIAPSAKRDTPISIDAFVREGQLHWNIEYHRDEFHPETIERLNNALDAAANCVLAWSATATGGLTPADLEYRGFGSLEELNRFIATNGGEPHRVEMIRPLVPMQEGMYFEYLNGGRRQSNRAQIDITIRGSLDLELFDEACHQVVRRYDALRTSFTLEGCAEPLAIVRRDVAADVRQFVLDGTETEERAAAIVAADWEEGFDLAGESQIRFSLITLGEDHYRLVLSSHHIVQDGWCIGLMLDTLLDAYDRLRRGEKLDAAPAPSYGAFLDWLRRYDTEAGLRFWNDYLSGYARTTSLPMRSKSPESQSVAARELQHHTLRISTAEIEGLVAGAARAGTTTNVLLRAAWSLLLSSYTGTDDLLFGGVVSGRPSEVERVDEIVGLFINTIPVRVRLDRTGTVTDLARAIAADAVASTPWHHNSIADLFRLSPLREKLFDHILVVQNYPLDAQLTDGLTGRSDFRFDSYRYRGDESFPLVVTAMLEIAEEIRFSYDPAVYDAGMIAEVADRLATILRRISSQADATVADIVAEFPVPESAQAAEQGAVPVSEPTEANGAEKKGERRRRSDLLKEARPTKITL